MTSAEHPTPEEAQTPWVGRSVLRREDVRLLTGRGCFVDDVALPSVLHVALVRSPHAHARVVGVETAAAEAAPGVVCVLSGAEAVASTDPFQAGVVAPVRFFCMASDRVRYVGEPVVAVVAGDRYLAEDAAELVEVVYEPLPAVVSIEDGLDGSLPVLHDGMDSNVVVRRELTYGDPVGAFAAADVVVSETLRWERYSSTPIETFGVIAEYEPVSGELTVWSNFMGPMTLAPIAARSLRLDESKVRFKAPRDIGGSFGNKCAIFPYITLVALLAMKTGRAVKWVEDRAEHLVGSVAQPDRLGTREFALAADGTILGMRARICDNLGAYVRAPEPASTFRPLGNFVGAYRTPNVAIEFVDVLTNRVPTGPNRGYGCQQIYLEQERALDRAAAELGMDPAELRRKNLIRADEMPYESPTGGRYDSGDYPKAFNLALEKAGYAELRAMQAQARAEGRLVGIGIATAVDPSVSNMGYITVALPPAVRRRAGYLPKSGAMDWAQIRLDPRGKVIVTMGTMPQGQGHETAVAQIVADQLGLTPDDVTVVDEFDSGSSVWSISSGTYSSRFASVATSAVVKTAATIRDQILNIGAHLLEAAPEDCEIGEGGAVHVRGTPAVSVPLKRIAGVAHWHTAGLPKGQSAGIQASEVFNFEIATPPTDDDRINSSLTYGFIAEVMAVEVDRVTFAPKILTYVSVHDAGTIINPKIVEGQIYGGALHGLGGALMEEFRYDDDGQFLSGSFMDYRCPTAAEAPRIDIAHLETPSPHTPLGSKGCGESSSESAPACVASAIADALAPLGVTPNHLPLTPARLWALCKEHEEAAL